jgi:hypothetical protein
MKTDIKDSVINYLFGSSSYVKSFVIFLKVFELVLSFNICLKMGNGINFVAAN